MYPPRSHWSIDLPLSGLALAVSMSLAQLLLVDMNKLRLGKVKTMQNLKSCSPYIPGMGREQGEEMSLCSCRGCRRRRRELDYTAAGRAALLGGRAAAIDPDTHHALLYQTPTTSSGQGSPRDHNPKEVPSSMASQQGGADRHPSQKGGANPFSSFP